MSGRAWRDDKPKQCGLCGRQWPTERLELVERLISATRGRSISERALRDLANDRTGDPALAGLLEAKEARILELEDIVSRLNQTIASNRKAS